MKQVMLVGALAAALVAGAAAQAEKPQAAPKTTKKVDQAAGHTAPKVQPDTAPPGTAPAGELPLGSVRLPKPLKADGKPLPAGTYQVRLTAQEASPNVAGQTEQLERWVEFLQRGQVKGREIVTIVPQSEVSQVQKDSPPPANGAKVEMLKGGDYYRVWINKGGNHYLIHLPPA